MKLERFHVSINDDGRLGFKNEHHAGLFRKYLLQFKGKDGYINFEEKKATRSEMQNRLYFLYLAIIADESGEDKEILHEFFKSKFLTTGVTKIYGDTVRIRKSTTGLNKSDFSEYLLRIEELTGVPIPDTESFWKFRLVDRKN